MYMFEFHDNVMPTMGPGRTGPGTLVDWYKPINANVFIYRDPFLMLILY